MVLIYIVALFLLIFGIALVLIHIKVYLARKSGNYPLAGQVRNDDILRLVSNGQTILAMRAYRELHRCGLKQAKKAINQIEKQMT